MSLIDEIERLGDELHDDVDELVGEVARRLREEALEHPQHAFALLRTLKPVLVTHGIAIVTRYDDVVEVLGEGEAFSVSEYGRKMRDLAGDFILGLDGSTAYRRDVSILRLAAPGSDVPGLAD